MAHQVSKQEARLTAALLTSQAVQTLEDFFGRRLPRLGRVRKGDYEVTIAGNELTVRKGAECFAVARLSRGWRIQSWMTLIKGKKTCTDNEASKVLEAWFKAENPLMPIPQ